MFPAGSGGNGGGHGDPVVVVGKKVCGILTEMFLKGSKIDFIVLGCGVNVNQMAAIV